VQVSTRLAALYYADNGASPAAVAALERAAAHAKAAPLHTLG
jgi:hypothetical protein